MHLSIHIILMNVDSEYTMHLFDNLCVHNRTLNADTPRSYKRICNSGILLHIHIDWYELKLNTDDCLHNNLH